LKRVEHVRCFGATPAPDYSRPIKAVARSFIDASTLVDAPNRVIG
jgi:hypothetical protein